MQQLSFSGRHPFWADLIKRIITIVVSWHLIILLATVTFFGSLFVFVIMVISASSTDTSATNTPNYEQIYGSGQQKLLSIKIDGTIVGDESETAGGLFSNDYISGYGIKKQLIEAADNSDIKGVVLEINSPGGTIYGAHAIADGVAFYRKKTKQPVYAHIAGLGASGAYWAAVSANKVVADYGSDIGSIGVIMGPFQYYNGLVAEDGGLLGNGVVTQNGIETTTITAGTSKDVGNPYRKLTEAEVQSLQQSVNNEYDNFVSYVSKQRKIPAATIREQIGAMIYDNKTAQQLGMIDQTASREDTYHELAQAAGIEKDFQVVQEQTTPGIVKALLGAVTHTQQKQAAFDACNLTRTKLAYQGDVTSLCKN